jgi:Zn-finger nucleic acid-binding protein
MTSQTKRYIELPDVLALRFVCSRCGANLSVSMMKEIRLDALHSCPNCREPWTYMQGGAALDGLLKQFVESFNVIVKNLESNHFPGFKLTIELRDDVQK